MMNNQYHAHTPDLTRCLRAYEMQLCHCSYIPCYIYDEFYMCMPTHAITHASFGHLYQKTYKFLIYHTIHVIISMHAYIDITSHYYSSNDIHQPLGRIVTRHVHNYPTISHVMALFIQAYHKPNHYNTQIDFTQFQPSISLNSTNDILQSFTNCGKNLDTNH